MEEKIVGIITARGGSKRIPRKNLKDFLGKPIIAYSIQAALESEVFSEVMVSTEDEEIASIAKKYGAKIPFMRTPETADDYATTADVLHEVLTTYQDKGVFFSSACCIYPTAPFVTPQTLRESYSAFRSQSKGTLVPIVRFGFPIQRALKLSGNNNLELFYPEHERTRSQDLENAYHDCGQFYWFNVKNFLQSKSLFNEDTCGYIRSELEVQDIDTPEDWKIAELKYKIFRGES